MLTRTDEVEGKEPGSEGKMRLMEYGSREGIDLVPTPLTRKTGTLLTARKDTLLTTVWTDRKGSIAQGEEMLEADRIGGKA